MLLIVLFGGVVAAGCTIVFSGLTVAVSMAALLVFDDVFLRSMAAGGIAVILVALVAAVTLLSPWSPTWTAGPRPSPPRRPRRAVPPGPLRGARHLDAPFPRSVAGGAAELVDTEEAIWPACRCRSACWAAATLVLLLLLDAPSYACCWSPPP